MTDPLGNVAAPAVIDRLACWLLAAVAADLVVTRVVVRLAIFVPKGEPWASASAWLGRVGAVTDVLVPLIGLLLLGSFLLAAGRGSAWDRVLAVGTALVAAVGLGQLVAMPSPLVAVASDATIALVAVVAVATWRPAATVPALAHLGIVALGGALAAVATARAVAVIAPSAWVSISPLVLVVGEWAFVVGAAMLGAAGLRDRAANATRRDRAIRLVVVTGLTVAFVLVAIRASSHVGQLIIWSTGLSGIVPTPVLAVAAALAIAGIPLLHGRSPAVAIGGSVVVVAGSGLAASGLALAGMLGLLIVRRGSTTSRTRR